MHMQILRILLLIFPLFAWAEIPATYSGLGNPCKEGDFLDIGENQCKALDKSFGFDRSQFNAVHPTMIRTVTTCTETALISALTDIRNNGGGTINIGNCDITLTQQYYLPSNTLIQGSGTTKTIIRYIQSFNSSSIFRSDTDNRVTNLILRDIKFIGNRNTSLERHILLFGWAKNVLVERVYIKDASKSAFLYPHTQGITVRYYTATNNAHHGLGAKECYPPSSGVPGSYTKFDCDGGDPDYWSEDVAIYSVYSHNNDKVGIDPHNSDFEMAGVHVHDNARPNIKIPEKAIKVWVHDNYLHDGNSNNLATKSQPCETMNSDWQTDSHAYYRNRMEGGASGVNAYYALYSTNVYLFDNIYRNNGNSNNWSHNSSCNNTSALNLSTVSICPNRGELNTVNAVGNGTLTTLSAGDSKCDLANIGSIF